MKNLMLVLVFVLLVGHFLTCDKNTTSIDKNDLEQIAVEVWLTTGDAQKKLEKESDINFMPGSGRGAFQIIVAENVAYQQMEGFGAALTNSAAYVIFNSTNRDEIMQNLFSSTDGIGISYLRLPMGASDFTAQTPYTYDDQPQGQLDMDLSSFSIEPDRAFIIPILKQAIAINPQLKVMASPWSAPAWMKSPSSLNGGSLMPMFYDTYANYFVKFVQAYNAEGISIDAITVQNEPEHTSDNYPTMRMQAFEQANFIKNNIGPAFQNNQIDTKILIWDHNWDRTNYALSVLNDDKAKAYISGSAWHCYGGIPDAQSTVHEAHTDKDIYFTECSGGGWDTGFGSVLVWNFKNLFIGAIRHWAKTVLLWNLALDENHGPHRGGCENCRGVITINSNGTVIYEPEYSIVGHLSKFVQPGAQRIESSTIENQIETVAFLNPDGSKVLVALNANSNISSFDVTWNSQHFKYNIPGQSVVSFKWRNR